MAQQEICQIVERNRETFSNKFFWYEVHHVGSQGSTIIGRSHEYTHPMNEGGCLGVLLGAFSSNPEKQNDVFKERQRAANSQVVAQLLAQGWEVASVSDGLVTMVRRNLEHSRSASSQMPTSDQKTEEPKVIIKCENCGQKLSIPLRRKNLHVTCPKCRHEFNYEFVEGHPVDD